MRPARFSLAIALLPLAMVAFAQKPAGLLVLDQPMPSFSFHAANGGLYSNDTFKGKPLVICAIGYSMEKAFIQRQLAEVVALQKQVGGEAQFLVLFDDPMDRHTGYTCGSSAEVLERINSFLPPTAKKIDVTSYPGVFFGVTSQWRKRSFETGPIVCHRAGKAYMGDLILPGTPETLIIDAEGIYRSRRLGWIGEKDPLLKDPEWTLYTTRQVHRVSGNRLALVKTVNRLTQLFRQDQASEREGYFTKYYTLAALDQAAASAYGRQLLQGTFKDDAFMLNDIAWTMVKDDTHIEHVDYQLAADLALRSVAISDSKEITADALDTAAYALFKAGNKLSALEYEQKAVVALKDVTGAPDSKVKLFDEHLAKIQAAQ